jgi:hypothetical protein
MVQFGLEARHLLRVTEQGAEPGNHPHALLRRPVGAIGDGGLRAADRPDLLVQGVPGGLRNRPDDAQRDAERAR